MAAEKRWLVYKHTAPNGKVYIGMTGQTPTKRWRYGYGYLDNPYFYKAIQKYGWGNFAHEILADGLTKEEAERMEIQLIADYQATERSKGYNIALGGRLNYSGAERLERLHRLRIGRKHTEATKRRLSEVQKGKYISPETRKKMSESHKGLKRTEEHLRNNRIAKFKPVLCIETGERFVCMLDA